MNASEKFTDLVRLERATLADLDGLLELHAQAFAGDEVQNGRGPAGYKNPAWHQAKIANDHYFKIQMADELVGGMVVGKGDRHYFLDALFIGPEYQNFGLGKRAMVWLEQAFPQATHWSLVTPHKSYRNHYFYEKHGYRKTGEKFMGNEPGMAKDFTLFIYEKQL